MYPMDAARAGAARWAGALRRSAVFGAAWAAAICLGWLARTWYGDPKVEITELLHTEPLVVALGATLVVALLAGLALGWYSAIVAAIAIAVGKHGRTPRAQVAACAAVALACCVLPAIDWPTLFLGPALSLNAWVLRWLGPCALFAFGAAQVVARSEAIGLTPPTQQRAAPPE